MTTWDAPVARGGSPRYILPTAAGLRWALRELRVSVDAPIRQLVDAMLPASHRRPLSFLRGRQPPFLEHQRECTNLAAALSESSTSTVAWVSTWDRPFPNAIGGVAMPQPDFVLVLKRGSSYELVFGEHDRGHESLAHFAHAKVRRYAQLAHLPVFCRDAFGFETFRVWVTVLDAAHQRPINRLRALVDLARTGGAADLMAFSLAGWVHAFADHPLWFEGGLMPTHDVLAHARHLTSGLVPASVASAAHRRVAPQLPSTPGRTDESALRM